MSGDVLVAARGVSRRYGRRDALRPTDVEVHRGEALALVGPNGAGKSTLLGILARAIEPTEGRVEVADGVRVGWMPQRPAHYARLTPRENLELFARLDRLPDAEAAAERLLRRFELPADGRIAASLSVGNRQRLDLALALLSDPDVLLLDEPTAALDPRQRRRLWEAAGEIRESGGAVVLVTQNLEDLARIADRVAVLLDGALVFAGTLAEWEESGAAELMS